MALLRCAALCLLLSCGKALVDDAYRGRALLTLGGLMVGNSSEVGDTHPVLRGAIFWNPHGAAPVNAFASLSEQVSNDEDQNYPGQLDWQLFDPPRAQDFTGPYAFGYPALYLDDNHNGQLDPGEHVVASTPANAIIYAARDLAPAESPTGYSVSAGYHTLLVPLNCGAPVPAGTDTCAVWLGAGCVQNADCGTDPNAFCVLDSSCGANFAAGCPPTASPLPPSPGGYCALLETQGGCQPANGRAIRFGGLGYWFLSCKSDSDCPRPGYQCDVGLGACAASRGIGMLLHDDAIPPPVCAPR